MRSARTAQSDASIREELPGWLGVGIYAMEEGGFSIDVPLGSVKVKVLPLDRIIVSKKAANRAKDKLSLKVLQDAAVAIREAGGEEE